MKQKERKEAENLMAALMIILAFFVPGFSDPPQQSNHWLLFRGRAFDVAAYPVKWPVGAEPPQPPAPFDVAAYPVKWPVASDPEAPARRGHLHVKPGVLFLKRSLYPGAVLPAGTKLTHATAVRSPRGADAVPLDTQSLANILAKFHIPPGSEKAKQVGETIRFCGEPSNQDEPHTCATSRRSALDFAAGALGTTKPQAANTIVHARKEPLRYVVAPNGITRISNAVVPCHPLPYPYEVFYCHRPSGVQALRVELVGQEDGSLGATAIAVCHDDTADWDPEYFWMLDGVRGEPICHYMPENYVLYVAS